MTVRLLLSFFLIPCFAGSQVVLSEIMFDPAGTDSPNEFVEIFNLSEDDTADLSLWTIVDNASRDSLTDAGMGIILLPRSYAVILEGDYSIESGIYASLIPDTVLLVKVDDSAIGNQLSTSDTVILLDGLGDPADSHGWEDITAPGFSLERIRLDGPSGAENWAQSTSLLGTPGTTNSVTPPDIDGAIDSATITHSPLYPESTHPVDLTVTILNRGLEAFEGRLRVAERQDLLQDHPVGNVPSGDSLVLMIPLPPLDPGNHILEVELEVQGDANPDNDRARHGITVRFPSGVITINEIHITPNPGVPEFVELVNLTTAGIDLEGWRFSDSDTARTRVLPSGTIPAAGFGVIAADSSVFPFVPVSSPLVVPWNGFPPLNDTGDTLHLFDPAGTLMDRMPYTSQWDLVRGRSLEKFHPNLQSEVQRNWGPSVALEGMTPGLENSIFVETLPRSGAIALDPNPFSPDGDQIDDELRISYSFPYSQAHMTVLVLDSRGRPVRTVAKNLAVGSQGVLTWDGVTDRGKRARIGIYVLKVVAVDRVTRKSLEWVKTVVLAEALR